MSPFTNKPLCCRGYRKNIFIKISILSKGNYPPETNIFAPENRRFEILHRLQRAYPFSRGRGYSFSFFAGWAMSNLCTQSLFIYMFSTNTTDEISCPWLPVTLGSVFCLHVAMLLSSVQDANGPGIPIAARWWHVTWYRWGYVRGHHFFWDTKNWGIRRYKCMVNKNAGFSVWGWYFFLTLNKSKG